MTRPEVRELCVRLAQDGCDECVAAAFESRLWVLVEALQKCLGDDNYYVPCSCARCEQARAALASLGKEGI